MMQITINIPDNLAAQVQARGLSPERYVEGLIAEHVVTTPLAADTATRLTDLELFFKEMAAYSENAPILPDEALTRESFYQDHD